MQHSALRGRISRCPSHLQAKLFADKFLTTPMAKGQYKMMTKEEIAAINFCESR